jgi:hypothetical protein
MDKNWALGILIIVRSSVRIRVERHRPATGPLGRNCRVLSLLFERETASPMSGPIRLFGRNGGRRPFIAATCGFETTVHSFRNSEIRAAQYAGDVSAAVLRA